MANSIHPLARLLLWGGWAAAAEIAAPTGLPLMAVALATAFLFVPSALAELLILLRRTRWLLAILFVTYALSVSGTAVWPGLGMASPTQEGLQSGALRVLRLVLMLAGLALLLATTSRPRLVYGLYMLARPLAWLGFDRRAFAVRLGLTLDAVEHAPRPARWLDALREPISDDTTPTRISMQAERWQTRDSAVILAALLLVGIAWA
ncbi:MAG: CbiQ family ECF transporter T component [Pseudomonadota bacterium]